MTYERGSGSSKKLTRVHEYVTHEIVSPAFVIMHYIISCELVIRSGRTSERDTILKKVVSSV